MSKMISSRIYKQKISKVKIKKVLKKILKQKTLMKIQQQIKIKLPKMINNKLKNQQK